MFRLKVVVLLVLFFCCAICQLPDALCAETDAITFGFVSSDPKADFPVIKPIIDYVALQLKDMGIKEGKLLLAKNDAQLLQYVKDGKVDVFAVTLTPALVAIDESGAKLFLRRWKGNKISSTSVIFARKDSGINSLQDLKGKIIALKNPDSTSGYYTPKAAILKQGLRFSRLDNYRQKPPKDKVGYCFAMDEEANISFWVYSKFVDAGAFSTATFEEDMPANFRDECKIVYKSDEYPSRMLLVRANMDPKLEQAMKKAFLGMNANPESEKIIMDWDKTVKFDEFPSGAEETTNKLLAEYKQFLKEEAAENNPPFAEVAN